MHIKPRRSLALSLAFFGFVALTASAAIPPVEKLLPDDTLFLVTTPDFSKMRELYRTSPQAQFWNDPAMKPFKDNFVSKLQDDLLKPLERDLGAHLSDYTNLLQGQITLAMTQNDWPAKEGQQPGLLFLLDTRDKSPAHESADGRAQKMGRSRQDVEDGKNPKHRIFRFAAFGQGRSEDIAQVRRRPC